MIRLYKPPLLDEGKKEEGKRQEKKRREEEENGRERQAIGLKNKKRDITGWRLHWGQDGDKMSRILLHPRESAMTLPGARDSC